MAKIELTLPDAQEDLFYMMNGKQFYQLILEFSMLLNVRHKELGNPIYLLINEDLRDMYEKSIGIKL